MRKSAPHQALLIFVCLLFLGACQSAPVARVSHAPYPEEWWTPVPREEAASWEILPQDAKPGEVILSKRNKELGTLSNFAPTPFVLDGVKYASVEGFWQMLKYPENPQDERVRRFKNWPFTRAQVGQMTAFEAKHAGEQANVIMKDLNVDWVSYRGKRIQPFGEPRGDFYNLIVRAERAKLDQNPEVKRILIKTGNLILKPDHHEGESALPAWKYYDIWMDLRAEL